MFQAHHLRYMNDLNSSRKYSVIPQTPIVLQNAQKVDNVTVLLHQQSMWVSRGHRDTIYIHLINRKVAVQKPENLQHNPVTRSVRKVQPHTIIKITASELSQQSTKRI